MRTGGRDIEGKEGVMKKRESDTEGREKNEKRRRRKNEQRYE